MRPAGGAALLIVECLRRAQRRDGGGRGTARPAVTLSERGAATGDPLPPAGIATGGRPVRRLGFAQRPGSGGPKLRLCCR